MTHACKECFGEVIDIQGTAFGEVGIVAKTVYCCVLKRLLHGQEIPWPEGVSMSPRVLGAASKTMDEDDVSNCFITGRGKVKSGESERALFGATWFSELGGR